MSGSVHTATLAPPRRAPRALPSLPALRAGVALPSVVPMLSRSRTLVDSIEPFLFWLGGVRGRRPLTIAAYRRDLTCFASFCREAGVETPEAIRHQHIEFYLSFIQQAGGRSTGTAARRLSTLKSFFKYLVREEIITRDAAAVSFGPKVTRRLPVYLTIPEQERVLATMARDRLPKDRRDHAAVALLLLTGLRADELLTLTLGALDLETGTLRVVNGKGGKDRELPVVPRLGGILRAYLAEVRPTLYHAASSPFVFLPLNAKGYGRAQRGAQLERRWLWRLVSQRVGAIVGRAGLYPHALRHSSRDALAAWFVAAGAPSVHTAPVFPNRQGAAKTPCALGEEAKALLKRAGFWKPGAGIAHRFRRSFATEYLRANPSDLEGLRRLLRHENIATTSRYVFLNTEDLSARLERVAL